MKTYQTCITILGQIMVVTSLLAQNITSFADGCITFDTIPNGKYAIEWKSTLNESDWHAESFTHDVLATGTTSRINVPFFYRVRWLNPPPYSITGLVRFAGEPIFGLSDSIHLLGTETGYESQMTMDSATSSFNFSDLLNDTYLISINTPGYLPYFSSISITNDHKTFNIDLEMPISPIWPPNGHTQSSSSILLEWQGIDTTTQTVLSYYKQMDGGGPIPIIWLGNTTTHQLTDLSPGLYRWKVQVSRFILKPDFSAEQIPVGSFNDWQEFRIIK